MPIKHLIDGHKQFRQEYFEDKKPAFMAQLLNGQAPKVLVIACSDSRVDPAIVTNCKPGDLFVIRNVANLVPPYEEDNSYHGTSAALEFGLCYLKIRHIIIFGHSQCGGITSLVKNSFTGCQSRGFIEKWMELAKPAYKSALSECSEITTENMTELCGKHSLINSLKNLQTFPWIAQKIAKNEITLHGWYFDLPTGTIKVINEETQEFVDINQYYNFF